MTRWCSARPSPRAGLRAARAGGRNPHRELATGQLVFLPLLASLTEPLAGGRRWRCVRHAGRRGVAVLLVMRDRERCGLRPFGDRAAAAAGAASDNAPIMAEALGALRECAKTRVFWILFLTFFICGAAPTA